MGYIDSTIVVPDDLVDVKKDGDPKVPNPAYAEWLVKDQQVFSYIISSMTRDILAQVASYVHARPLWQALEGTFASQTRARAVNIHIALATTRKGALTVTEYIGKMRSLADEMAAAGKPLDDEDLVSYIVAGLNIEYNPVISAVLARVEPITLTDLYAQLLSFEQRMDLWQGSHGGSANVASRGGGRGNGGGRGGAHTGGRGAYRGRGNGGGRGRGGFNNGRPKIKCQLCKK